MLKRNWKRVQPTGLRNALELCKDHAREMRHRSVERIAEEMGLTDHWALYKWLQSGRMPVNLVRPYETSCGIDFVTRWLACSEGRLLISIPTGRHADPIEMAALQGVMHEAVGKLLAFYSGKADAEETLGAIQQAMEGLAWHRGNVQKHAQPELELDGEEA